MPESRTGRPVADADWAIGELEGFLALAAFIPVDPGPDVILGSRARQNQGQQAELVSRAAVVEQVLDRVLPDWWEVVPADRYVNRWVQHMEAAQRAIAVLRRQSEVDAALGDDAPRLAASSLHPWVWEGARSLWRSGHFREAVEAAAKKVNAETQNKLGRRDTSETDLFHQAFSKDEPKPDRPRLRLGPEDDPQTSASRQRGARALGEACFAGLRNPISHAEGELPEDQALEQLAMFSVLARWVDDAEVTR